MRGFRDDDAQEAKLTDVAAELVRQTEKALLISDGVTEAWVPKSQVEDNRDGTFTMPEWLAKERGLI